MGPFIIFAPSKTNGERTQKMGGVEDDFQVRSPFVLSHGVASFSVEFLHWYDFQIQDVVKHKPCNNIPSHEQRSICNSP